MFQRPLIRSFRQAAIALTSAVALTSAAHAQAPVNIPDKSFPESVTSTSDGALYVGSFNNGGVTKVAPGGKPEQLVKPGANDSRSTLGVLADEKSGTLYVCSNDLSHFGVAGPNDTKGAWLKTFDLKTGAPKGSFALADAKSFCNDIVVGSDGTAYISDSVMPNVYSLKPGGTKLEIWATDPKLAPVGKGGVGLDGIAIGAATVEQQNHQLQKEKARQFEIIINLQETISIIEIQNSILNEQISALTLANEQLVTEIESLQAEISNYEQITNDLITEVETLNSTLQDSLAQNEELQNEVNELTQENSDYQNRLNEVTKQNQELSAEVLNLQEQNTALNEEIDTLVANNRALNEQVNELSTEIETLEQENQNLAQENEELKAELVELNANYSQLQLNYEALLSTEVLNINAYVNEYDGFISYISANGGEDFNNDVLYITETVEVDHIDQSDDEFKIYLTDNITQEEQLQIISLLFYTYSLSSNLDSNYSKISIYAPNNLGVDEQSNHGSDNNGNENNGNNGNHGDGNNGNGNNEDNEDNSDGYIKLGSYSLN